MGELETVAVDAVDLMLLHFPFILMSLSCLL